MKKPIAVAIGTLGAVAAIGVPALAANPKDGAFIWEKNHQYRVILQVNGDHVIPQYYGDCSPQPLTYPKKIKIDSKGKFAFDGTGTDALDRKVKIHLKGEFETKKKATGTIRATTKTCSAASEDFVAKLTRNG